MQNIQKMKRRKSRIFDTRTWTRFFWRGRDWWRGRTRRL